MSAAGTDASSSRHVIALDVLRGIAAMVVLLGHCTLVYPLPIGQRHVTDVLLNQRAAVLIFFVLSGYVLTLSWQRLKATLDPLRLFYVRRFFRLMPALWLASLFALVLLLAFPLPAGEGHLTEWMHASYRAIEPRRQALAFTGIDNALLPPVWTITAEIMGSIAMPFIVMLMSRSTPMRVALIVGLAALAFVVSEWHSRLSLLAFLLQFAVGCALALATMPSRLTTVRALALGGLLFLFGARPLVWLATTGELQLIDYRVNAFAPAAFETLGAAMLIAALASRQLDLSLLNSAPLRALGAWSYSVYLVHFPILRLMAYALPTMTPAAATLLLTLGTVTLTLLLASLSYRVVEMRGMELGRRLTANPPRT